jgi:sRNA-binding carbon storage regulator CsrA
MPMVSRKVGEAIVIADNIRVTVMAIQGARADRVSRKNQNRLDTALATG